MSANGIIQETELIDAATRWLGERMPDTWIVERAKRDPINVAEPGVDDLIELRAPNGTYSTVAVEARAAMEPRDVDRLLTGIARSLRALAGYVPLLIVAPWLSGRTRELLAGQNVNYLDLTGNALLKLDNPAVFIQSDGAARNPNPEPRKPASIRGPRAARLIRLLVDVRPPYGVTEIASAADVNPGYVSRLLDALDRDALITRGRRGVVDTVDVPALLRAWASDYDVFKRELVTTYVAPAGAATALAKLADTSMRTTVTGSFAAVRLAPVAAPSLLAIYCEDPRTTAEDLGLLPADDGANVTLLRPFDDVVWERVTVSDGVSFAAASQVAVDCLTGNGRMPAEGEAVLGWMAENEDQWRQASLPARPLR
ncbi:hypothetical protein NBH00_21475 [Paraconexibacter antarcticus]|uniref:Uncharacterized protein n=1 Tax=Paraconexibacter antarcticus TaxID=2949664 RepID=A0ABY5DSV5_9ACTN|nr:hypothetical protein [Paraconexibacter antarcticus]UTI63902.1 hypothetical protein NBH00_21475 [Paraconexibacter antarcticus]